MFNEVQVLRIPKNLCVYLPDSLNSFPRIENHSWSRRYNLHRVSRYYVELLNQSQAYAQYLHNARSHSLSEIWAS